MPRTDGWVQPVGNGLRAVPDSGERLALHGTARRPFPTELLPILLVKTPPGAGIAACDPLPSTFCRPGQVEDSFAGNLPDGDSKYETS